MSQAGLPSVTRAYTKNCDDISHHEKDNPFTLTQKAMQALTNALAKVVAEHRRQDRPLAVWRDGKAIWISATEAGMLHERTTRYRTTKVKGWRLKDKS